MSNFRVGDWVLYIGDSPSLWLQVEDSLWLQVSEVYIENHIVERIKCANWMKAKWFINAKDLTELERLIMGYYGNKKALLLEGHILQS